MNTSTKSLYVAMISLALTFMPVMKSDAAIIPSLEVIRQATIRVIKAFDLMVQRMQNQTIWLQNAQKVLENKLNELKLDEIADWTSKHKQLYENYFDELMQVKRLIADYQRIREITQMQISLYKEYQHMWQHLQKDNMFTEGELQLIYRIYTGMIAESLKNIDGLILAIQPLKTQMSDQDRLAQIHQCHQNMQLLLNDMRRFNAQNMMLASVRNKDYRQIEMLKNWYSLQ